MCRRPISIYLTGILVWSVVMWAGAASAEPFDQVIKGAKEEGTLNAVLESTLTPKSIRRLEREIKEKFGVELKIRFTPSSGMAKQMATAIMEHKAGAPPSNDLMLLMSSYITEAVPAGIVENVNWRPLITANTPPKVVLEHTALRGAIINYTTHLGLLYNPEKISAGEVPRTLNELSDSKWKGKVGVFEYTTAWARWAFVLGKEKVQTALRSIMLNGAIQGRYVDLLNRYLLGEIWLDFTASNYMLVAQNKGMPAAWQNLDWAEVQNFSLIVRTGARHPNASKLVAVYLASPEGSRFMQEEGGAGNLYYPGNSEHDISSQAEKEGIPESSISTFPGLLDFYLTEKFKEWRKEMQLTLKTGGER